MVTIESNVDNPQEMLDAAKAAGLSDIKIVESPEQTKAEPAVEQEKPDKESEQSGEPGENIPAETESETGAEKTEPVQDKSQEKTQEPEKIEEQDTVRHKAKGGFQAKNEKLTRELAAAQAKLEIASSTTSEERAEKERLRAERDELQAKLVALQPKEPDKPAELIRPTRPTRSSVDFDDDKYEVKMTEYETAMDKYNETVADRKIQAAVASEREERRKADVAAEDARKLTEFGKRLDESRAFYEDFDEYVDPIKNGNVATAMDKSSVLFNYVGGKSKEPAHLMRYFCMDHLENGGAAGKELLELDEYDQLIYIRDLEKDLIAEYKKSSKKNDPKEQAEDKPKEATPAKEPEKTPAPQPPRAKTPDAPIGPDTVGSRATAKGGSDLAALAERAANGDTEAAREYRAKFNASQAKKHAGGRS